MSRRSGFPPLRAFMICAALLSLTGCASETLFRSNFDTTPLHQPPSAAQGIGTANIDGPAGSVLVEAAPPTLTGKWLQVSRPQGPATAGFQGKFVQFRGAGVYTFSATMYLPAQAGVATIQFEPFTNQGSDLSAFLHLDFMPDNQVRIDDDDATKFGSFPRNQPFIVQVTLNINATSSTARIVLAGAGVGPDNTRDHTILAPLQNRSQQFGAIRVWQGFPHVGAFKAANIAVTKKKE